MISGMVYRHICLPKLDHSFYEQDTPGMMTVMTLESQVEGGSVVDTSGSICFPSVGFVHSLPGNKAFGS